MTHPRLAPAPVLALTLLTLLSGCANVHHVEVGAVPDDYRIRHPITVSEAQQVLDIPVPMADGALSFADRGRVEDFARRFKASGASGIQVLLPSGSVNEHAANRLSVGVVSALRRMGVPKSMIFVQPYGAAGLTGPVPIRVVFATLVARTERCGVWDADLTDTSENRNYTNFGCASQQNLAAQVADPRDLLHPRGMGEIDANQRTNMLGRWRGGQSTASGANRTESNYDW